MKAPAHGNRWGWRWWAIWCSYLYMSACRASRARAVARGRREECWRTRSNGRAAKSRVLCTATRATIEKTKCQRT
jgi:hypothetical protein